MLSPVLFYLLAFTNQVVCKMLAFTNQIVCKISKTEGLISYVLCIFNIFLIYLN